MRAALEVHVASLDAAGPVDVSVETRDEGYWSEGAVVRPLARGVRTEVEGRTASFRLPGPGQYSVERPAVRDLFDEVLVVFVNPPEASRPDADDPRVLCLGPGVHRRDVDLASGETLYLAAGAVLVGSVDVWDAANVRVLGRGTIVHDGPQAPYRDQGYWVRRDWRPISIKGAADVTVEGVISVARSRTWNVQAHTSRGLRLRNVKLIAAHPSNRNGDGVDLMGSRDVAIEDCFIRSSDDALAFYTAREDRRVVAPEVADVAVDRCVFWTTAANVLRLSWTGMNLVTRRFAMRDSDVIHQCEGFHHAPWALLGSITQDEKGAPEIEDYLFEDVRLEDSSALVGIEYPEARIRGVRMRRVTALTEPDHPSALRAVVDPADGVTFEDVRVADRLVERVEDIPMKVADGVRGVQCENT
jgi:hypothetical protein